MSRPASKGPFSSNFVVRRKRHLAVTVENWAKAEKQRKMGKRKKGKKTTNYYYYRETPGDVGGRMTGIWVTALEEMFLFFCCVLYLSLSLVSL